MKKKIKVLHVVGGTNSSGAFKGAYLLHNNLILKGIKSKILSEYYNSNYSSKISSYLRKNLEKIPKIVYWKRQSSAFSTGLLGYNFLKKNIYKDCDIIHLHWVNEGFFDISILQKIKKPIVWTLRDMWLFTGGCHYTLGCEKFKQQCKYCPQLGSKFKLDLSTLLQNRKRKYLQKKIHYVAISNWLKKQANKSKILKEKKINVIYNGINDKIFYKINNKKLREKFKIPKDKKIILFAAQYIHARYKGYLYFIKSLKYLDKNNFFVLLLGSMWNFKEIQQSGFQFNYLGFKNREKELREIYNISDVLVMPSVQESFGKVAVESIFCGTPVVSFKNTALEELIIHKKSGYLADYLKPKSLAKGILWLLKKKQLKKNFFKKNDLVSKFSTKTMSKNYINLYNKILKKKLNK